MNNINLTTLELHDRWTSWQEIDSLLTTKYLHNLGITSLRYTVLSTYILRTFKDLERQKLFNRCLLYRKMAQGTSRVVTSRAKAIQNTSRYSFINKKLLYNYRSEMPRKDKYYLHAIIMMRKGRLSLRLRVYYCAYTVGYYLQHIARSNYIRCGMKSNLTFTKMTLFQ